jgi:FdhD protein
MTECTDTVASEHSLEIEVNGQLRANITCSPAHLKELTAGYLYSSGVIRGVAGIRSLSPDREFKSVKVETVCTEIPLEPVADEFRIPLDVIKCNMEQFLNKSTIFKTTGAVHSCAMSVEGKLLHFMEDIGRHNAFDKTVGAALLEGIKMNAPVVMTSGRVPGDMLLKLVYSRVPVVVSRSAPTDEAIELAKQYNITLCGFARAGRINIYAGSRRVEI